MTFIHQNVKHAWYSPKMAKLAGTCFYRSWEKPDQEVEVTCVTSTTQHGLGWDDVQYLGTVCGWLRSGMPKSRDYY